MFTKKPNIMLKGHPLISIGPLERGDTQRISHQIINTGNPVTQPVQVTWSGGQPAWVNSFYSDDSFPLSVSFTVITAQLTPNSQPYSNDLEIWLGSQLLKTIPVQLTVSRKPASQLVAKPSSLDFGELEWHESAQVKVVITNVGDGLRRPVDISNEYYSGIELSRLKPDDLYTFPKKFTASVNCRDMKSGQHRGTITVTDGTSTVEIPVSLTVKNRAILMADIPSINLSIPLRASATASVTITNVGGFAEVIQWGWGNETYYLTDPVAQKNSWPLVLTFQVTMPRKFAESYYRNTLKIEALTANERPAIHDTLEIPLVIEVLK